MAAERVDPLRALVVAVQDVLPGEADAAVHLDRALAGGDCGFGAERLRRRDRNRRPLILLFHTPRRPVGERAGELGLDVGIGERVRDGLVGADLLAELLAGRDVLDAELERLLRDTDRLERKCR